MTSLKKVILMKRLFPVITVLLLLAGLCACAPSQPAVTSVPTEPEVITPDSLKVLAVDTLDVDLPEGVGAPIIYEDEERVIFYTRYGLFAYDLIECKMIFTVDHVKAFGMVGSVQGEYATYAAATPDGKKIVFYSTDPECASDAYYIDVETMTWKTDQLQDLDAEFDPDTAKGVVIPGGTVKTTRYVLDDETWDVFSEYFD